MRSRHHFLADGVDFVIGAVDRVRTDENQVLLEDGRTLGYDQLVIASGKTPRPDQTPGERGLRDRVEPDFMVESIDNERKVLVS